MSKTSTHRRHLPYWKAVALQGYLARAGVTAIRTEVARQLFGAEAAKVLSDLEGIIARAGEVPSHGTDTGDYGAELTSSAHSQQAAAVVIRESALGQARATQIALGQSAASITQLSAQYVATGAGIPISALSAALLDMQAIAVKGACFASHEFFAHRSNDRILADAGTGACRDAVDATFLNPANATAFTNGLSPVAITDSTTDGVRAALTRRSRR